MDTEMNMKRIWKEKQPRKCLCGSNSTSQMSKTDKNVEKIDNVDFFDAGVMCQPQVLGGSQVWLN
jgi:hypothetical protein